MRSSSKRLRTACRAISVLLLIASEPRPLVAAGPSVGMTSSETETKRKGRSVTTLFDEGFTFVSEDDELRLGAWAQADLRMFLGRSASADTFLVRRARLLAAGVLERDFNYLLMLAAERPTSPVQFAWLEYARFPFLRFRVGQFKQPFGMQELLSDLYYEGAERSVWITSFAPAQDIGVMAHGELFGGLFGYGVGLFNGSGRNVPDSNAGKDVAWRLTVRPSGGVFVGTNATWGEMTGLLTDVTYRTAGGTVLDSYAKDVASSGIRTRIGFDVEAYRGPLMVRAEAGRNRFGSLTSAERSTSVDGATFDGAYVEATWLITGEEKKRNRPVQPKRPLGGSSVGPGAWELFARQEWFRADPRLFRSGLTVGVSDVRAVTVGTNWWPNRHIRGTVNYVLSTGDGPLQTSFAEHLLTARVQFEL